MEYVILFLWLILSVDLFLLIIGLWKPTLVVWWEDIQNRRRVINIYGKAAVVVLAGIYLLIFFNK